MGKYKQYRDVKTSPGFKTNTPWTGISGFTSEPIDTSINEFYLIHGTKPEAVRGITTSDFRVDLAGSHAGTLYGRGIYFAESSSKSDEYTTPDPKNKGLFACMLCRVLMGNINYQDQVTPDAGQIVKSVVSGSYHSVLGDREKCRNTYREFIVYDNAQAYPEWIVYYDRQL